MKVTRIQEKSGERFTFITTRFSVKPIDITFAVCDIIEWDQNDQMPKRQDKITKKKVERRIKDNLHFGGVYYSDNGRYEEKYSERQIIESEQIAKATYPDFFIKGR